MIKEINGQNHGALNQSASYHVAGLDSFRGLSD